MGIVLAFVVQCLLEERIDGWVRHLGEDDLRTRGRTAGGLLDCGKAALPALYKLYESPPGDDVKFRAGWLIERIVEPILKDLREKHAGRGGRLCESESPYLPGCRILRWSRPCRCCCLHREGHGGGTVLFSIRDAKTYTPGNLLAMPEVLRRHLRPIKDKQDAFAFAETLLGSQSRVRVEKGEDGIVIRLAGRTLCFDREGRLVSSDKN